MLFRSASSSHHVDSFFDIFFDANVCGDECPKPPAQPDDVTGMRLTPHSTSFTVDSFFDVSYYGQAGNPGKPDELDAAQKHSLMHVGPPNVLTGTLPNWQIGARTGAFDGNIVSMSQLHLQARETTVGGATASEAGVLVLEGGDAAPATAVWTKPGGKPGEKSACDVLFRGHVTVLKGAESVDTFVVERRGDCPEPLSVLVKGDLQVTGNLVVDGDRKSVV